MILIRTKYQFTNHTSRTKNWVTLMFMIGLNFSLFSQKDSLQYFEGINIFKTSKNSDTKFFDQKSIQKNNPHDLGSFLSEVNGITIRDYGGVGGMKTISMRGMGGEHTKLIINNSSMQNAQNSLQDYSLIPIENVKSIEVTNYNNGNKLIPANAKVFGSSVQLETVDQSFTNDKILIQSSGLIGSFQQYEIFNLVKLENEKRFISFSNKSRYFGGEYPFQTPHDQEIIGYRQNNQNTEHFVNLGFGNKVKKENSNHLTKLQISYLNIDKELPGATILYNDHADETITNENFLISAHHSIFTKKHQFRAFINAQSLDFEYEDPTYNNAEGFIRNEYLNKGVHYGINSVNSIKNGTIILAADAQHYSLEANRNIEGKPTRNQYNFISELEQEYNFGTFNLFLAYQFLEDENLVSKNTSQYFAPKLSFTSRRFVKDKIKITAWSKRNMRPPGFNELYYSQIGNIDIIPEKAWQNNIGLNYTGKISKVNIEINTNVYYNLIEDKIQAIPTKNLFIWSVQNIGLVRARGMDLNLKTTKNFKQLLFTFTHNSTFQKVEDFNRNNTYTYLHQIAYTPEYTMNNSLQLKYQNWFLNLYHFYYGRRFSLNQNIESNLLPAFQTIDLNIGKVFHHNNNEIEIKFGVKNIANNQYEFIRSFPMPGRNYFLQLKYKFNK